MTRYPVTETFTPLHYTCRHFTSTHLKFTQLHFTTLSFGLTPFEFLTSQFHLTSLHFTPFIIAFLTLFLKILGLQVEVPNASAGSWFHFFMFASRLLFSEILHDLKI